MLCKICVKPQGRGALTPPPLFTSRTPPLFLHILYKLYISHTKHRALLQNLYRDCTVPWSIPAKKGGTIGSFR